MVLEAGVPYSLPLQQVIINVDLQMVLLLQASHAMQHLQKYLLDRSQHNLTKPCFMLHVVPHVAIDAGQSYGAHCTET